MGDVQNTKCYNIQCKAILQRRYKIYNILDDPEYENPKTLRAHFAILIQRSCTSSSSNQFSVPCNPIHIRAKILPKSKLKPKLNDTYKITRSESLNELLYQHLYIVQHIITTIPTIWLCWDVQYVISTLHRNIRKTL